MEPCAWWARPTALAARAGALLPEDERARAGRRRRPEAREAFLAARVLVRLALARATGLAPEGFRLTADARGRPRVGAPAAVADRLAVSWSHTSGLVACAVAEGAAVGVDVERLDRRIPAGALAARWFAPEEARALRALPPAERGPAFLGLWTLKEAWAKARGTGLAGHIAGARFALEPAVGLVAATLSDGPPDGWRFERHRVAGRFWLAVAARGEAGPPGPIAVAELRPEDAPAASRG